MSYVFWILFAIVLIFALTALTGAPYVPSKTTELKRAFRHLYKLGPDDLLVDLGSGDGVVLKAARECGARAFGVEINPLLVFLTKVRFWRDKKVQVRSGNLFRISFPAETTVVYVFGEDRDINKMAAAIAKQAAKLGRDLYVISHAFPIKNLKPLKTYRAYFLYRIKA